MGGGVSGSYVAGSTQLADGSVTKPKLAALATPIDTLIFGSGSAGAVTYAGANTLTGDVFATTITVDTGATVNTAGYRIFATTSVTINGTGVIQALGLNASGATQGAAGTSNSLNGGKAGGAGKTNLTAVSGGGGSGGGFIIIASPTIINNNVISVAGGNGAAASGAEADATNQTGGNGTNSNPGRGGAGGAGGTSGGTGGTLTAPGNNDGGVGSIRILPTAITGAGTLATAHSPGAGGAGGGMVLATSMGGGGGGGGGTIVLVGKVITQGTLTVTGGTAGAGSAAGAAGVAGSVGNAYVLTLS